MVAAPGGKYTFLHYYNVFADDSSESALFGDVAEPANGSWSRTGAGLLARVTTNLYHEVSARNTAFLLSAA